MKRLKYIDMAKGLVILQVGVVHYCCPENLSVWLMAFIMPLMFILSGITFNVTKYTFKTFAIKKIKTLLFPWIIAVIVNVLFQNVCLMVGLSATDYTIKSIPKRIFLVICSYDSGSDADPIYWFMPLLFVAELVLFFLLKKIKNVVQEILTFVCFICLGYLSKIFINRPLIWEIDIVPIACIFILIGYYLNKYAMKKILSIKLGFSIIVSLLSIIMGTFLIFLNRYLSNEPINIVFRRIGILPITIIAALLISLPILRLGESFNNSLIMYIGKNSLLFYLSQPIIYKIADIVLVLCSRVMPPFKYNYLNGGISLIILHLVANLFILAYVYLYTKIKHFLKINVNKVIHNESKSN